ncbi:hypothetical protein SO802_005233, partial [Lithocarpus litseifolius]
GLSKSRNHVYSPSTRGRSTKKFLSIKSENLNIAGLKEVQPRCSARYLMILKSPKTHQAVLHLPLTLSSSVHKASLRPSAFGPYTPVHIQSKPSATPFNKIETEKHPTRQSIFLYVLIMLCDWLLSLDFAWVIIGSQDLKANHAIRQHVDIVSENQKYN